MEANRRSGSRDFHRLASLRLERLARQSTRYADADYRRKIGLGVLHCRLIGIVGSNGALNFRQLCMTADIEKGYASRLVAQLLDLGFIGKSADPSDQRSFKLSLTAAGRRAYNRIYRIALQRNDTWMAALTPEQRKVFFDCLGVLERESSKHIAKARIAKARQGVNASNAKPRHMPSALSPTKGTANLSRSRLP
jgi:DNA-binding MarR family transcriptional regulator